MKINPEFNKLLAEALEKEMRVSNGDKIRSMSDEELAEFLFERGNCSEYCYGICAYQNECDEVQDEAYCIEQIVKWLNQEAEND